MNQLIITKNFEFSASHFLTKYNGKCERLHGHNYRLELSVIGDLGNNDIVYDFVELKTIVKEKIIDQLDHTHLNDRFENPSAEIIAIWIWDQLDKNLKLYEVKIWETSSCSVTYRGKNGFNSS